MARHLETAPFFLECAISANQEGAPLNAFNFFAVHDLVLDNPEHVTHFFFGVGNQFEGEFQLGFELVMRFHVVTRHTKHGGACFHKVFVFVPELHRLCSAARCIVLRVEVQDDGFPKVGSIGHSDATGGIGFKFRDGFIDNNRHSF